MLDTENYNEIQKKNKMIEDDMYEVGIGSTQETNIVHKLHHTLYAIYTPYIYTPYTIHTPYIAHRPRVTACTRIHTHSVRRLFPESFPLWQANWPIRRTMPQLLLHCIYNLMVVYGASMMLYMEIHMRLFE